MPKDIWELLNDSLSDLRREISSLNDRYAETMRKVWIKITEIEVSMRQRESSQKSVKDDLKWLVPTILAIISLFLTYYLRSAK